MFLQINDKNPVKSPVSILIIYLYYIHISFFVDLKELHIKSNKDKMTDDYELKHERHCL